jgi:putative sterol carrier protein
MANDDTASAVRAIFDSIPKQLDPAAAANVDALIRINLTGNAGGTYFVEIHDGSASISNRSNGQPQLTMTLSAADYVALIEGKMNAQLAFLNGKLKMVGDMGLAMKLPSLFRRA